MKENIYNRNRHEQIKFRKKRKSSKIFGLFLIFTATAGFLFFGAYIWGNNVFASNLSSIFGTSKKMDTTKLQTALDSIISNNPDTELGVSFINLNTGDKVSANGDKVFTAASTGKLVPACLFLKDVENGTQSLTKTLGNSTAKYQLKQMINQSNNDSWTLFNTLLGLQAEQDYGQQIGMASYTSDPNRMSANDMAVILEKLYKGKLLNKENTNLLLSYMQHTNDENLIPAIAANATVYHKYGELDGNIHDGAIVDDGKNHYILTIFTNNAKNYDEDQRAQIFKQIFDTINGAFN